MSAYTHVLVATDFSDHCNRVAERARQIADQFKARLSMVHIVDNLPIADATYGPVIPMDVDFTEELMAAAKSKLNACAEKLNIAEADRWLELGSPTYEIVRIAEEQKADLIVAGSHGRHGLALLLGSTANSILHHAKCDVLAVRLQDD